MRLMAANFYSGGEKVPVPISDLNGLADFPTRCDTHLDLTLIVERVTKAMMMIAKHPLSVERVVWERGEQLIISGFARGENQWEVIYGYQK